MKKPKLGIIGGGQLGRMLTIEAHRLGIEVTVIDPTPNSPAAQVGASQLVADYDDPVATKKLFNNSDIVTYEIEHINADQLIKLEKKSQKIHPSPHSLATIKDKLKQKEMLESANIPLPDFVSTPSVQEAEKYLSKHPKGIMIKSRTGGYDGKGNWLVKTKKDITEAFKHFNNAKLYAEELIELKQEIAVIATRGDESTSIYDPVDTVHVNNICHTVVAPSQATKKVQNEAMKIASKVLSLLKGRGVFAIEMFVTKDDKVLVNEVAPRVHNSGHHTIEGAETSQFAQHVRAVMGLPLGSPKLNTKTAVMVNIIGENANASEIKGKDKALGLGANIHWYGKSIVKPGRKMGHLTVIAMENEEVKDTISRALKARNELEI